MLNKTFFKKSPLFTPRMTIKQVMESAHFIALRCQETIMTIPFENHAHYILMRRGNFFKSQSHITNERQLSNYPSVKPIDSRNI